MESRRKNCFSAILQICPRILWCSWARSSLGQCAATLPTWLPREVRKPRNTSKFPGHRMSAFFLAGGNSGCQGLVGAHATLAGRQRIPVAPTAYWGAGGVRGDPAACRAISQGGPWEERERRGETERRGSKPSEAFFGIWSRLCTHCVSVAILDSLEGDTSFSGRLPRQHGAAAWSITDGDALEEHSGGHHELLRSPARGGVCRNCAASSRDGMV